MNFSIHTFNQLTNKQLYQCLELRFNVFVLEQNCLYPEFDEIDEKALHILGIENNEILGYSRIYTDNSEKAKIGRVVVNPKFRNKNLGKTLMKYSIQQVKENFSQNTIEISAQSHLEKFYASFGFKTISEPYPDYDILHIDMQLHL